MSLFWRDGGIADHAKAVARWPPSIVSEHALPATYVSETVGATEHAPRSTASGDSEEVSAIGSCEPTVPFDDERSPIGLFDEDTAAACKLFGLAADFVGKTDGGVADEELREGERRAFQNVEPFGDRKRRVY